MDEDKIKRIIVTFERNKETEATWNMLADSLASLNTMLWEQGSLQDDSVLLRMKKHIQSSMLSERSKLSKTALTLLESFSALLQTRFCAAAPEFVPSLIKLFGRANKVFVLSATQTLHAMIVNAGIADIIPILHQSFSSPNKVLRASIASSVNKVLECNPPSTIEPYIPVLDALLKAAISDAAVEVRSSAKATVALYYSIYPELCEAFIGTLDISTAKSLTKSLSILSNVPSLTSSQSSISSTSSSRRSSNTSTSSLSTPSRPTATPSKLSSRLPNRSSVDSPKQRTPPRLTVPSSSSPTRLSPQPSSRSPARTSPLPSPLSPTSSIPKPNRFSAPPAPQVRPTPAVTTTPDRKVSIQSTSSSSSSIASPRSATRQTSLHNTPQRPPKASTIRSSVAATSPSRSVSVTPSISSQPSPRSSLKAGDKGKIPTARKSSTDNSSKLAQNQETQIRSPQDECEDPESRILSYDEPIPQNQAPETLIRGISPIATALQDETSIQLEDHENLDEASPAMESYTEQQLVLGNIQDKQAPDAYARLSITADMERKFNQETLAEVEKLLAAVTTYEGGNGRRNSVPNLSLDLKPSPSLGGRRLSAPVLDDFSSQVTLSLERTPSIKSAKPLSPKASPVLSRRNSARNSHSAPSSPAPKSPPLKSSLSRRLAGSARSMKTVSWSENMVMTHTPPAMIESSSWEEPEDSAEVHSSSQEESDVNGSTEDFNPAYEDMLQDVVAKLMADLGQRDMEKAVDIRAELAILRDLVQSFPFVLQVKTAPAILSIVVLCSSASEGDFLQDKAEVDYEIDSLIELIERRFPADIIVNAVTSVVTQEPQCSKRTCFEIVARVLNGISNNDTLTWSLNESEESLQITSPGDINVDLLVDPITEGLESSKNPLTRKAAFDCAVAICKVKGVHYLDKIVGSVEKISGKAREAVLKQMILKRLG